MDVFITRNGEGKINAVYSIEQGFPTEAIDGVAQEVLAFLNPPSPVPVISRRQFFQQAAINGIITQDEALAAVTSGALPASILAFIGALPADQQFASKMLFSAAEFQRSSPLANAFGQTIGMTPDQIDAFFTAAAQL